MTRFQSVLALLVALVSSLAASACQHAPTKIERYNAWKNDCYELSRRYLPKLAVVPYHMIADRGADRCSSPDPGFAWDVDPRNMAIVTMNFFYHYDRRVQRRAFEMLEAYDCARDKTCGRLADWLDAHLKASAKAQSSAWMAEFHARARAFWRHLQEIR